MRENPDNIAMVHKGCAPSKSVEASDALIGQYVKKVFPVPENAPTGCTGERMWVKINGRVGDTLFGILDNDPVFTDLVCGDEVSLDISEVIDVMEDS